MLNFVGQNNQVIPVRHNIDYQPAHSAVWGTEVELGQKKMIASVQQHANVMLGGVKSCKTPLNLHRGFTRHHG
jgi:hypothetical protein